MWVIYQLFEIKINHKIAKIVKTKIEKIAFNKGTVRNLLALSQYYSFKGYRDSSLAISPELEKESAKSKDVYLRVSAKLKCAVIYSDLGTLHKQLKGFGSTGISGFD